MKTEHLKELLSKSVDWEKGARAKNLKVYIAFFSPNHSIFEKEKRKPVETKGEKEFYYSTKDFEFYFDEWDWGVVVYHTQDEDGTRKIEQFLRQHPTLRIPWLNKERFYELTRIFVKDGGKIVIERTQFQPHNEYSGYGITVQVRGRKTKEVINRLEKQHALHPRKIGIEMGNDGDLIKFEMTNQGRISFSSGLSKSIIFITGKYVSFLRKWDESYGFSQSHKTVIDGVSYRQIEDIVKIKMPSIKKIKGTIEKRNEAILNMFTSSGGAHGYIGIPLGPDRANILDLRERKSLQLTINDDELFIYSENPSEARSAIRRLVSRMASYIDPDIDFQKITIGE